jgi:hypothetical protein
MDLTVGNARGILSRPVQTLQFNKPSLGGGTVQPFTNKGFTIK